MDSGDLVMFEALKAAKGAKSHPEPSDAGADAFADPKASAGTIMVDIALEAYDFACTPDGVAFATARPEGHVARLLRGGRISMRAQLAREFRRATRKLPSSQACADAMLALEGEAQDAEPVPLALRVAKCDGCIWVDLGDAAESVIKVTPNGWEVVTSAVPVTFLRTALTGEFPRPERGGNIGELWTLLNVAEDDRPLVLAWMVAAIVDPDIPHPVLSVFGEQGTGKSTASKRIVQLIDPSPVELRKAPKDSDAWVTAAQGSWVVGLDNLSTIQPWFSDTLCRAATGDGDVRRRLYTDGDLAVFSFRRCVLLNGIDVGALAGDLADRLIQVNLARIPDDQRRSERDLAAAWADAYPRLVGALLDEVAATLAKLPSVRLESAPRMADFAHILAALDARHGTDGLGRYARLAAEMAADSLTADPFISALTSLLAEPFRGTSAELLAQITDEAKAANTDWKPPRGWPNARAITGLLKRNAPALRKQGWTVEQMGINGHAKAISWAITPTDSDRDARKTSPQYPQPPQNAGIAGVAGVAPGPSLVEPTCLACGEPINPVAGNVHPGCG